jgi:hypothetical protein
MENGKTRGVLIVHCKRCKREAPKGEEWVGADCTCGAGTFKIDLREPYKSRAIAARKRLRRLLRADMEAAG